MQKEYIGTAIKFPFELIKGRAQVVNDDLLIQQSILRLLNTPMGSRRFLREYGFRGKELLFEPNDDVLKDLLRYFIGEAIRNWETRVRYIDTTFIATSEDCINCVIEYQNLKSNSIESFIYPFYKKLKN